VMSESQLVNACIKWLMLHNVHCWRNNTGAYKPEGSKRYIRYGYTGSPDIVGMTKSGRFLGIECKVGKNALQDSQKAFQARCDAENGLYIVVRELDDLHDRKQDILAIDLRVVK